MNRQNSEAITGTGRRSVGSRRASSRCSAPPSQGIATISETREGSPQARPRAAGPRSATSTPAQSTVRSTGTSTWVRATTGIIWPKPWNARASVPASVLAIMNGASVRRYSTPTALSPPCITTSVIHGAAATQNSPIAVETISTGMVATQIVGRTSASWPTARSRAIIRTRPDGAPAWPTTSRML